MRISVTLTVVVATGTSAVLLKAQDADRVIADGGIHVPGWTARSTANSPLQGRVHHGFAACCQEPDCASRQGPATTFWNPANTASGRLHGQGDVFEPKFMNRNDHPHSYGLFIGGNDMGTDAMTLVYCVAYGDGTMLVVDSDRRWFTLFRTGAHAAVHKAAAVDQPVTPGNHHGAVRGNRAECLINGTSPRVTTRGSWSAPAKLK